MRYVAELLIFKPLGVVLTFLAATAVFFFGVMFTIVEIVDIILTNLKR